MTTPYQQRADELKATIYDRYIDADHVFADPAGTPAIPVADAVEITYDLMTDGDNYQFFNRCPACSCGSSGQANALDCACWCHDPEHGLNAYIDQVSEIRAALADLVATLDLIHHGLTGLPELARSLKNANDTLTANPPPRE